MTEKIFGFGGGVQSTAALCLAAMGKLDYKDFVFCNVGHDSENPATLDYVHKYSIPFAATHGLNLYEIHKTRKDGTNVTLYQSIMREDTRSVGIPVRMAKSGAPGRRSCTADYKIRLTDQWAKKNRGINNILERERGYRRMYKAIAGWAEQHHATEEHIEQFNALAETLILATRPLLTVGIGISTDEWHRAKRVKCPEWKQIEYPLLDMGISRENCYQIIEDAGLPRPPWSSCWFCPFHSTERWREIKHDTPALFVKAGKMEDVINQRRKMLGKDNVYLHRSLKPLMQAIPDKPQDQATTIMEEQEQCVEGGCLL
jgi:hypothetical protein